MNKTVLAVATGVALLGVSVPVLANSHALGNNHGGTQWAGILPKHQGNIYTNGRDKTDASSGLFMY